MDVFYNHPIAFLAVGQSHRHFTAFGNIPADNENLVGFTIIFAVKGCGNFQPDAAAILMDDSQLQSSGTVRVERLAAFFSAASSSDSVCTARAKDSE